MTTAAFSNHQSTIKYLLFLVLICLLLSGCAPLVRTEQPVAVNWGTLSKGQTLGQTFVAKYDGLAGIYFYLSPQETGTGEIRLHLRSGPQAADDLAVSLNTLAVDSVKAPSYYGFFVPAQASSNQKYYYAFLEVTGNGDIQVGEAAGDAYLNGALYQNGTPEDAQAAFQLSYSRRKAILGLGWEAIIWGGILAVGFFLFILPGWGLFSLFWPGWGGISWPEKLGLSAGLSLAIYPLLLLWTEIIGLHLGAIYAWLPPLAGLGMILWRNRKRLNHLSFPRANAVMLPWADIAFIGIMVLIVFTRFWVIRSLDVPMWGDSYQHTMITQLLVDHGGLFNSWQPFAELTTFTYHFGFHSAAAVFDWITHLDMSKAVLWVGQLLNVLAVIVLYPLAVKVGRSRWAGVVAVLVAGLFSPMPMYYVNWGRYTQLAGQVILPVAIYLAWVTLEMEPRRIESPILAGESNWSVWRRRIPFDVGRMALTWVVLGGLALTHYRILIFAILFLVAFFIQFIRRNTWRALLARTFWIGIGAGLLFLPWFIHTFTGKITLNFATQLTTQAEAVSSWTQEYNAIGNISFYLPVFLWLLLPVSIIWGLWRREKGVALISLWSFLVLLAANPQWLRLPGEGALSNFAVFIAAYIPVSVLAGYLMRQGTTFISKVERARTSLALGMVITVFVFVAGIWCARQRLGDLQVMSSALITRPDIRAAEWIQENTPQDARFLVNSFFAFGDIDIVGSDGGWWLPLLARRQTTLPPLNYESEQGPLPNYVRWINALTAEIQKKGVANPDVLGLLRERGITYVYIGQRQGRVNYGGPNVLEPEQLHTSPNFSLVYHQDRVWVFEITNNLLK
jgi:hypothetical protein